ncbi:MAG: SDR family NAD(P)-dependent oxidoreductase [Chloroflexi bacterium]|nr:SDR family NAD(P)-dependent oxidoreductase [Chloroflexota bacterium]
MTMQGKVAIVTGGGTGLGREISKLFAARGASVAIVYARSREDAEATAREIGGGAKARYVDITPTLADLIRAPMPLNTEGAVLYQALTEGDLHR